MYLTDEDINIIKTSLEQQLDPYLIVLFGSASTGRLRSDSDVDIAFLSDQEMDSYELFIVAQQLADQLGREVHLIDLNQASTVLQAQVVGKGQVILDKEPNRRQEYFILVLKKYARLNEERAPILNKIKERGSIYAR
ncbi:MAG: nucleotidyltransferase domain-containing protein [Syntrophomonadaceae bacterium]|nr:nucleotidyltransferase domain-containing protein [Syntrophomonadaceae bacterium]